MTSLVDRLSVEAAHWSSRATLEMILAVVLMVLLIEREVIRAYEASRAETDIKTLNIYIRPLLVAFAGVLVARLLALL